MNLNEVAKNALENAKRREANGAVILVWEDKERRNRNAKKNRRLRKMSKRTAVQDVVAEEKSEP